MQIVCTFSSCSSLQVFHVETGTYSLQFFIRHFYKTIMMPITSSPPHPTPSRPISPSVHHSYAAPHQSKANCIHSKRACSAAPTATQRKCQSHDRLFHVLCFIRMDVNRGCSPSAALPGRGNANNAAELVCCLYSQISRCFSSEMLPLGSHCRVCTYMCVSVCVCSTQCCVYSQSVCIYRVLFLKLIHK